MSLNRAQPATLTAYNRRQPQGVDGAITPEPLEERFARCVGANSLEPAAAVKEVG